MAEGKSEIIKEKAVLTSFILSSSVPRIGASIRLCQYENKVSKFLPEQVSPSQTFTGESLHCEPVFWRQDSPFSEA